MLNFDDRIHNSEDYSLGTYATLLKSFLKSSCYTYFPYWSKTLVALGWTVAPLNCGLSLLLLTSFLLPKQQNMSE